MTDWCGDIFFNTFAHTGHDFILASGTGTAPILFVQNWTLWLHFFDYFHRDDTKLRYLTGEHFLHFQSEFLQFIALFDFVQFQRLLVIANEKVLL